MSRKVIGIPGFQNAEKMFGVTGNYMEFAHSFGDVRILMPWEEFVPVDLLLLPGGLDLSPTSYGAIPGYQNTNHDVFKEFFFKKRLQNYVDAGTPIFGICLGFQMLNVFFGGTLKQNLLYHAQSAGRWTTAHEIIIPSPSGKKEQKIKVNSHHHQAVMLTDLAPDFNMVAYCDDEEDENGDKTKIVEAFKHKTLKIAGVQYHPEELYDGLSKILIEQLLR